NRFGIQIQVVADVRRLHRNVGDTVNELDDGGDRCGAVERISCPFASEIAPLGKLVRGSTQPFDGSVFIDLTRAKPATRASQRPPNTFRWILELRLKPASECFSEQPLCLT